MPDFLATNRRQRPFSTDLTAGKGQNVAFRFLPSGAYPLGSRSRRYFCARPSQSLFFPPVKKERLTGIRSRTDPELDSVEKALAIGNDRLAKGQGSIAAPMEPSRVVRRSSVFASSGRPPSPRAPTPDPIAPETRPTRRSLPAPRRAPVARSRRRASLPREARPSRLLPVGSKRGSDRAWNLSGATAGITA